MPHAIWDVLAMRVSERAAGFGSSMYMPLLFFFSVHGAGAARPGIPCARSRPAPSEGSPRRYPADQPLALTRAPRLPGRGGAGPSVQMPVFLGQGRAGASTLLHPRMCRPSPIRPGLLSCITLSWRMGRTLPPQASLLDKASICAACEACLDALGEVSMHVRWPLV